MSQYDVVIIGAGTAGLTARREVAKSTDNYVLVDDGPLGTTCARVGCMPSKVLVQTANDFSRRKTFDQSGIFGGELLGIEGTQVLNHVRALRDRFVKGVKESMPEWENKLMRGRAEILDRNTLKVGDSIIGAKKIIIAAGSRPIIPKPWEKYKDYLIDTNHFFEMDTLPKSVAVLGLGVIGIELGQALNNLGVEVVGVTVGKSIGGLTDPEIQDYVIKKFSEEFPLHTKGAQLTGISDSGLLKVEADGKTYEVEKALVAVGRRPNIDRVGLENLGIELSKLGIPEFDRNTMRLKDVDNIYIAGDITGDRPILHEAADEGVIAGHNAVADKEDCFKRRVPLGITFSEPNIATIGKRYLELIEEGAKFVTGKVSFEGQGRSIVKLKERGLLYIYADSESGKLLGAELQAPDGEHIAHLLSWAISLGLTAAEALRLPFYHPVVEEGLRTALRDAVKQIHPEREKELFRCQDPPIR